MKYGKVVKCPNPACSCYVGIKVGQTSTDCSDCNTTVNA